jgi:hypothetical protein
MATIPRARILNKKPLTLLFDHILDGFKATHEGSEFILKEGIITTEEHYELLQKNAARLIARIREFKIANNLLSILFASLFTWMQVSGQDLDMRRSSRRSGRRRNETEITN